ncbi:MULTISPECIES: YoqO family protein [Bacillus]|uniref:YoqO family protein n=1 Tax=Bacillus TaxID=1386 RepID=UPI0002D23098|nr:MULTISPECIES: YoqO family protein [Bacillus]MEB9335051.1 YoqO family protein [Bacillus cereus]CCW08892.1 membrane protein, putative [Bacillus sp. GeD10]HEF1855161.1 YoqO family protein [Bacillus cereus]HEF1867538.1 YoqO family protein [Bacillus cereus]HEF1876503.1 YoqO family protein [Bacillus cereus]
MRERIGYYGVLVCLLLSVISGQFLNSGWVPVILCIGVLIFAPMYRWNEWKAYSRKKKMVFSIEFIIIISMIPFLLLKGNEIIDGIVMFQEWLFIAKLLYLICILMLVAIVTKKLNEKLFVNE